MEPKLERRFLNQGELRVKKSGDKRTIFGYATKFAPVQSADLGGFIEEIHPNAFDECLRAAPDVVGLWNHDTNHVLGRTTSGTLRLSVDKTGLLYEIDPPNTGLANDLMELMDRGDIHQSSFGFYCIEDSWREGPNGTYIRTVLKAELFDVSPVTFPAYPDATSGVRQQRHKRNLFPDGCDAITCKLDELRAAKVTAEVPAQNEAAEVVAPVVESATETVAAEAPVAAPAADAPVVPVTPEHNSAEPSTDAAQSAPAATRDSEDDMDAICELDPDADGCDEYLAKKRAAAVSHETRDSDKAETELLQLRLKLRQHRAKTFNR